MGANIQIYARVSEVEKVAIEQAAESLGLSLSEFVRMCTLPQAYRILKQHQQEQQSHGT